MGQYDIALRHVVQHHGTDLARVLLPRFPVESATWVETQLAARERRLDKALEVRGQGRRQLLQIELAVRARRTLAYRMFEYAAQLVMAEHAAADNPGSGEQEEDEPNDAELDDLEELGDAFDAGEDHEEAAPVPVESAAILLSGRRKRWPTRARFRTSAPGCRFSGQSFCIEAVYQRTVAELWSRPGTFWLVFTPLALDANRESLRQVIEEIRRREPCEEDRADLYAALLVLAELDPWKHNLRKEVEMLVQELDVESIMKSQTLRKVFEEGMEKGIEKGIERGVEKGRQQLLEEMLRTLLVRHLQRDLTPAEQAALSAKASTLDGQQAAEAMRSLDGDALRTWLLGPDTA